MVFSRIIKALPLLMIMAAAGCNEKAQFPSESSSNVKEEQADNKANPAVILADSVESLQQQSDALSKEHTELQTEFAALLTRFKIVNDPLLVEPYRVVAGWENYDTTGKQGILSRVLEDGTIEIIVTAAGDFSTITFESGGQTSKSKEVPAGNALHHTLGNLTRVAFNNAAYLAAFVSKHADEPVTLRCGNAKTFTLSDKQKKMIADTYAFSQIQGRINELDKRLSVINNKLQFYQNKLEEAQSIETQKNK